MRIKLNANNEYCFHRCFPLATTAFYLLCEKQQCYHCEIDKLKNRHNKGSDSEISLISGKILWLEDETD